jgi:sugar phosphate isomerase/epimerase
MKIGIDSYCYHRFFGEVYPDQEPAQRKMTMQDFLTKARELGVDGVSLESCFFESLDDSYIKELRAQLDEYGFDRVFAWGHPDGLERGKSEEAFMEMKACIPKAKLMGADVMRVTGSSLMFRHEPHGPQIQALSQQFKEAVKIAEDNDIKLAVENHIDYNGEEMLQLLESVGSKSLGVNFDTGNFLRLLDDPIKAMEILAPHVLAVHLKDLQVNPLMARPTDWFFFSGVPVGEGLIDNQALVNILAKTDFKGFLAVEIDHPHVDWMNREDECVEKSVVGLKTIVNSLK